VLPLRDRREDVLVLPNHFLALHRRRHGVEVQGVNSKAMQALQRYDWPGNVRELEKAISRAVVLAGGKGIEAGDLDLPPLPEAGCPGPRSGSPNAGAGRRPIRAALEEEALRIASADGTVCRRDLAARFSVSGEAIRQALVALVRAGRLLRSGRRRGTRYTLVESVSAGRGARLSEAEDR
jgi:DNA-binding NtrC family response regulator